MVSGADFEEIYKFHIAYRIHFSTSVSALGIHFDGILHLMDGPFFCACICL